MLVRFSALFCFLAGAMLAGAAPASSTTASPEQVEPAPTPPPVVFEGRLPDYGQRAYTQEVERLFSKYEAETGRKLVPGPKGKVGLKVYSDSGPGMATPLPLVRAVIAALERRGFESKHIFLVGLNQMRLRMTGFLPSLIPEQSNFKGHPVYVLESGKFYNPVWYYDSPLPERFDPIFIRSQTAGVPNSSTRAQDRKSFLATPLFLDADFWINLPVYTDHPVLGVNGALVNATLWNASNTARFFRSTANAPAAVAEMSAIPELRETWEFTLVSLEHYQFVGGPYFNSLYTISEPLVWLSRDPVLLDSLMKQRLNHWRKLTGFQPIRQDIHTLDYAQMLGVGSTNTEAAKIIKVDK